MKWQVYLASVVMAILSASVWGSEVSAEERFENCLLHPYWGGGSAIFRKGCELGHALANQHDCFARCNAGFRFSSWRAACRDGCAWQLCNDTFLREYAGCDQACPNWTFQSWKPGAFAKWLPDGVTKGRCTTVTTTTPAPTTTPKAASCMSGNTGVARLTAMTDMASGNISSVNFSSDITAVKHLTVGDRIFGLDAARQRVTCTIEAVGQFGVGMLWGNYTEDHYVLDMAKGVVRQHGRVGNRTTESKYEVLTSCPVGLDESGTGFTPVDSDFCGMDLTELPWSDYLLIHTSMLRVVRHTGGYWFSRSAYADFGSVVSQGPRLCSEMIRCASDDHDCTRFEELAVIFISSGWLTDDATRRTKEAFPQLGQPGKEGSASFIVSAGGSRHGYAIIFIIAACVVVALVVFGVGVAVKKWCLTVKRSSLAVAELPDSVVPCADV